MIQHFLLQLFWQATYSFSNFHNSYKINKTYKNPNLIIYFERMLENKRVQNVSFLVRTDKVKVSCQLIKLVSEVLFSKFWHNDTLHFIMRNNKSILTSCYSKSPHFAPCISSIYLQRMRPSKTFFSLNYT